MFVKVVAVFLILLFCFFSDAQNKPLRHKSIFITWIKGRKLTLKDFKIIKMKIKKDDYTAMTYSDLFYQYKIYKDTISISINCVFNTNLSWFNASDTSQSALAHEQGHFDIGEAISREMKKEFMKIYDPQKNGISAEQLLKILKQKYAKRLNKLNKLYDHQTDHSVNVKMQKEWEEKKIPNMLLQNESYYNVLIIVTR